VTYPHGYVKGVGPAAPPRSQCPCGRPAVAQCEGCMATFCQSCWWRHSHTTAKSTPPAKSRTTDATGVAHA
jgi:hypothetical protein